MPAITLALLAHHPDLVLLTEFRTTIGGQIAGVLADHGLHHQHSTAPPRGSNGLLLASRFPFSVATDHPLPSTLRPYRWLDAYLPALDLTLTGVHVPDDSRPTPKARFWQAMLDTARRHQHTRHLFMGDLNTGRHFIDEPARTFGCTVMLGAVCTLGYQDAFRTIHGSRREATWEPPYPRPEFSRRPALPRPLDHSRGFRLDTALLSGPLCRDLHEAWYSHAERAARVSDHSIFLLRLHDPAAPAPHSPVSPALSTTLAPSVHP